MTPPPRGPLDGIRVIDLTTVMLGPFCTMILGEMGADVIKVEPPGGDIGRWTGVTRTPGMSAAYMMKGRNKRSVVLDLKRPEAREPLRRLVESADVFVHNMRPKAAARLAIDYETIVAWKPDIVYAATTGYGEAGPYVDRPAYDDLIQGASGLAALNGEVTGTPRYGPSVLADKTTGLFLTYAIAMALFHRERTGEGQRLHVPMYEAFTAFLINEHMQGRAYEPPLGPAGYRRVLSPSRRPYRTADGHVCALPYNDRHWRRFFEVVGRPELADDARFADQAARSRNIDSLYAIVDEIMPSRSTAEWLQALEAADIPVMPMNTPEDLFDCPHLSAVGMFPEVEHPSEGRLRHLKVPVNFSRTPGGYYRHAEHLGQSTDAVLAELGYAAAEIAGLRAAGATGSAGIAAGDIAEPAIDDAQARSLPSALDRLDDFRARLAGRRPAVFLDYDGTLTPIVARPELATFGDEMRASVDRLAALCPVAVISGRGLADVRRLVGLERIHYAGSHGYEICGPDGVEHVLPEAIRFPAVIEAASAELQSALDSIDGALVEAKRYSVAVHYRLVVDADRPKLDAAVDRALTQHPDLRKTLGKMVYELRPALAWDKGKAVRWMMAKMGLDAHAALPIYIGDDVTDEDAFRALADDGMGILVGASGDATAARYALADPKAVEGFLDGLAALLRQRDERAHGSPGTGSN